MVPGKSEAIPQVTDEPLVEIANRDPHEAARIVSLRINSQYGPDGTHKGYTEELATAETEAPDA